MDPISDTTLNQRDVGPNLKSVPIYIQKRRKLWLPDAGRAYSEIFVATMQRNLEALGFRFSRALFARLASLEESYLTSLYEVLLVSLKEARGSHRTYTPMYPNFPQQVLDTSEFELYWNALIHYWTNVVPTYEKRERPPLAEDEDGYYEQLDLGSKDDFFGIYTRLLSSKSSIPDSDKAIIIRFVELYREQVVLLTPYFIPMKEHLAVLVASFLKNGISDDKLTSQLRTPTDVLRVASALCGGDVSLAENTKFKHIGRSHRRYLLSSLEGFADLEPEMLKHLGRWLRLGEVIHPGEFQKHYPRAIAAFKALRNNHPITKLNSKVESALRAENVNSALSLLCDRPGELGRRLDHLLRLDPANRETLESFFSVANQIATPVLLQIYNHFQERNRLSYRAIFPKGDVAKIKVVLPPSKSLSTELCLALADQIREVLIKRFSKKSPLGNVYLDPRLKHFKVPFSQRSASKALRTIVRGSTIKLDGDYDVIRFFIWWKDGKSRTDLDLSAVLLSENWDYRGDIAFYNLKDYAGHHSGDIVSAPEGASEFIDMSLSKVLQTGSRYLVMCVNSFTQQPYCDLPECFAGWMGRSNPDSGEIYEPKTVRNKVDLASNTAFCIPLLIDALERRIIGCDLGLKHRPRWNAVANNKASILRACQVMTELRRTHLYDLFLMHTEARGTQVQEKGEAQTIFSVDEGITPFDIDTILADYL